MSTDALKVRTIFLAAIEDHGPDRWDSFLGAACNGDPDLRRRVEALLRAHVRPNELLDDPNSAPVSPVNEIVGDCPGTMIGSYKLLEQIGEGGFGVVFMAEQQQPVRRMVALKVVKPGMDSRHVIARFEAERQALALMDHPNIAHIFDGGQTASGRPYFVMELVRGIPITDFCDQHRSNVNERLELFIDVCQAVQHAHQKGIIHRDLKPSNVMVTSHDVTPVIKVIDFGIAKATVQQLTDKTLFTNFAQFIGTPTYISPEQSQMSGLDVDTRSDVYSLGVLLYELMTNTTPFDKERLRTVAYDEMLRIIREEEPAKPSTRMSALAKTTLAASRKNDSSKQGQLLRGELDWIVMKALEKDRNLRYESASAFAADVRRYLRDEPVQACPPSAWYRLRKTARRYKVALATAAVVVTALSVGTAIAVSQAIVATRAKEAAEARETETRAVLDFVEKNVLSAARPKDQDGGLGREATVAQAIDAALPFVQTSFANQPLIEARLRMTLGRSFSYLGDPKRSCEQFGAARSICSQLLGPDHPETLRCMSGLAISYSELGRHADALKLQEETLSMQSIKLGRDHPQTLLTMQNLAVTFDRLGRYADALTLQEETLALWEYKAGRDHPDALYTMQALAVSLRHLGKHAESLKLHEEAWTHRKAKLGPHHPETLQSMYGVACGYSGVDRHDDAFHLHERTLALRKAMLGPDHPETLQSMSEVANSHYFLGRHTDALTLHEETLASRKAKLGPDHPDTLVTMFNLGFALNALGRHQECLALREDTLARRKKQLGEEHPSTLASMHVLGSTLMALDRHAEAIVLNEKALALRKERIGPTHVDTFRSMHNVAANLINLGRGTEAVSVIDRGVKLAAGAESNISFVSAMLDMRLRYFEKRQDAEGCRATAAIWDSHGRDDVGSLYDAACMRSVTSGVFRAIGSAAEAEKEAEAAMEWLQKAVNKGYANHAHMSKDKDLDPLRDRPEFSKLLTQVEEKK